LSHVEGLLYDSIMLALLRDCTSESMNPRPCFQASQYRLCSLLLLVTLLFFHCSDYKNLYLLSILHLYHHLFAELVHLYNLPLYWVCWGHKRLLVFDCKVVWERPSSSYTSHGLINLRSSTWGKFAAVLQNSALGGPTESTRIKLRSRHHASDYHHVLHIESLHDLSLSYTSGKFLHYRTWLAYSDDELPQMLEVFMSKQVVCTPT
jgi:hypothetical protein